MKSRNLSTYGHFSKCSSLTSDWTKSFFISALPAAFVQFNRLSKFCHQWVETVWLLITVANLYMGPAHSYSAATDSPVLCLDDAPLALKAAVVHPWCCPSFTLWLQDIDFQSLFSFTESWSYATRNDSFGQQTTIHQFYITYKILCILHSLLPG